MFIVPPFLALLLLAPVQPSFRNPYPYGEATSMSPNRRTFTSDTSAGSADLGVSPTNAEFSPVPKTSENISETPPSKYTREKNRTRSIQEDWTSTIATFTGTISFFMSAGGTPRASPSLQRTTYSGMIVDTSSAATGKNTVVEAAAITDVRPKHTPPSGYTASTYRGTIMLKVIMNSSPTKNFAATMRSLLQQTCLLLAQDIPIEDVTVSFAQNKMFLPCVTIMRAAS